MNWVILAAVTVNIALTSTLVVIAAKVAKRVENDVTDLENHTAEALELVAQGLRRK